MVRTTIFQNLPEKKGRISFRAGRARQRGSRGSKSMFHFRGPAGKATRTEIPEDVSAPFSRISRASTSLSRTSVIFPDTLPYISRSSRSPISLHGWSVECDRLRSCLVLRENKWSSFFAFLTRPSPAAPSKVSRASFIYENASVIFRWSV